MDEQNKLLNSILLEKAYEFVYANKYLIIVIGCMLSYFSIKYCINKKNWQVLENINLSHYPETTDQT